MGTDRPLMVTLDHNVLDEVSRPERYPGDREYAALVSLQAAVLNGKIICAFSETILTIESTRRKDRTRTTGSFAGIEVLDQWMDGDGHYNIVKRLTMMPKPRPPIDGRSVDRIQSALQKGVRVLRAPVRAGMPQANGLLPAQFVVGPDNPTYCGIIDKMSHVSNVLESEGYGFGRLMKIVECIRIRKGLPGSWSQVINQCDEKDAPAIAKAVAEWADCDAIAAHIGHGMDVFCTRDQGRNAGSSSILGPKGRGFLKSRYNARIATPTEIADGLG